MFSLFSLLLYYVFIDVRLSHLNKDYLLTEPNEKALRWAFIKCTLVSKTSTIAYLGLGNRVRVTVSIDLGLGLVLGFFVKAPSSDFNQALTYP